MHAAVRRVWQASVEADGRVVAAIGAGLVVRVHVADDDTAERARALAGEIHRLRFPDAVHGRRSALGLGLELLLIRHVTYAAPWLDPPESLAVPLVDELAAELRRLGNDVAAGRFDSNMSAQWSIHSPYPEVTVRA